jgi:phage-related minor tail protein
VEPQEYDEMLRALTRIAARQEAINTDLRACVEEQRLMNARVEAYMQRQDGITERLTAAVERLDTLMARALRRDESNGREA